MKAKTKAWITAARPRTLPLSISGIIVGTGFALREGFFNLWIFLLALLTTLGLQTLSNFANDYGDAKKGTDNDQRIGPKRGIQQGLISMVQMKRAMWWTGILTFVAAAFLIFISFDSKEIGYVLLFFGLGILAIIAAIKYTVGKTAYGYQGLGDLFVFLFFGLLSVVGSYFLYSHHLLSVIWILGAVVGLLSAAVINLNNMRDIENDRQSGKHTLAVKLGNQNVKGYHFTLILLPLVLILVYIVIEGYSWNWLLLIAFIPLGFHLNRVAQNQQPQKLDPELKKVSLSTVFFAILYFLTGL